MAIQHSTKKAHKILNCTEELRQFRITQHLLVGSYTDIEESVLALSISDSITQEKQ